MKISLLPLVLNLKVTAQVPTPTKPFVIAWEQDALLRFKPDECFCLNGSTCENKGTPNARCRCINFWTGVSCQQPPKCDQNPCVNGPCSNVCTKHSWASPSSPSGGDCDIGDFICSCPQGWSGKICDQRVVTNPPVSNPTTTSTQATTVTISSTTSTLAASTSSTQATTITNPTTASTQATTVTNPTTISTQATIISNPPTTNTLATTTTKKPITNRPITERTTTIKPIVPPATVTTLTIPITTTTIDEPSENTETPEKSTISDIGGNAAITTITTTPEEETDEPVTDENLEESEDLGGDGGDLGLPPAPSGKYLWIQGIMISQMCILSSSISDNEIKSLISTSFITVVETKMKTNTWASEVQDSLYKAKFEKKTGIESRGIVVQYRFGYRIRFKISNSAFQTINTSGTLRALSIFQLKERLRRRRKTNELIPTTTIEMQNSIYDALYAGAADLKAIKIDLGQINGQPYPVSTILMQRLLLAVSANQDVNIFRSSNDCIQTECDLSNGNKCQFQTNFETFFIGTDQGCICTVDYEGITCTTKSGYAVGIILGVLFGVVFISVVFIKWGWPFIITILGKRKKRIAQD